MYSLVNSNFNRTYNPSGRQNALSDIKRLLTSRDSVAQSKACGYLIEVVSRYSTNSEERGRMVEYLLDNDITVFLCEATSNLDYTLFKLIISSLRLLWRSRRFFSEEHSAHAMTAVLRALAHYAGSGPVSAVEACMHFLCDLLNGISANKTTSPLSHQSAYSAIQLLACLSSLSTQIHTNQNSILSSALVLDALISYQPDNLAIKGTTATALVDVVKKWLELLMAALNHAMLVGNNEISGMLLVVLCQLGISSLSLTKLLYHGEQKVDFVQSIITDEQEITTLKQCAVDIASSIQRIISELVSFTKEHQNQIATEEYGVFLKFLLNFFYESINTEVLPDFCDMLFNIGYLIMLPQAQIVRNDISVRKASTLVLGELLKILAEKYLNVNNTFSQGTCANDIHMGLVELQYGIERPQSLGTQLQKGQPYSLLIYIYFYCQSSDNPEEATGPLLPYLVEHILRLPRSFKPPPYIIKALWLVYAMSTISNRSLKSLDERVYLEKATDCLVEMLHPEPSVYYTHNPAILLWAFTSKRISNHVKIHVKLSYYNNSRRADDRNGQISQWLNFEETLPIELTTDPTVWQILLNVLVHSTAKTIVMNCLGALHLCLEGTEEEIREEFSVLVWEMLPSVLSKALIDETRTQIDSNICYLLDLATTLLPLSLDSGLCYKTAVLVTAVFAKNSEEAENKNHFEYVCLKICLYLLGLANNQKDNRVLLTYVNRAQFLPSVLSATNSSEERVACAALQLLSYVVHYFTRYGYKPKFILQIQTNLVIQSLRRDSYRERGSSLLQLVYMVLSSGVHTPLALAYDMETPGVERQCNALRGLMFRIQLMLCCRESKSQSSAGWKTLSSVFKHAIDSKNDTRLVAALTSQPWTHTLIKFQLSELITLEFLTFTHYWLTLLRITIQRCQEQKVNMCRHSLVIRTMKFLKKNLKVEEFKDEMKDTGIKIHGIVSDILCESGIIEDFHDSGIVMSMN